jgi:hypothetical protein
LSEAWTSILPIRQKKGEGSVFRIVLEAHGIPTIKHLATLISKFKAPKDAFAGRFISSSEHRQAMQNSP